MSEEGVVASSSSDNMEVSSSSDNVLGKRQERESSCVECSSSSVVEDSEISQQNKKMKRGYEDIIPENALFYNYYFNIQKIVKTEEEMNEMIKSFQEPLPTTFRINKSLPLDLIEKIQSKLNEFKVKLNNYIYLDGKIFPKEQENDANTIDIINLNHINQLFYQIHPNISKTKLRKSTENDEDDDIQQFDTSSENTTVSADTRIAEGQSVLREFREYLVKLTDIGYISRQELVSMIPPLCFTPQDENLLKVETSDSTDVINGKLVDGYLDMCSAPGSKSAQMVEYYLNQGDYSKFLICNDIDRKRLGTLFSNLNREPNQLTNNVVISHYNAVTLHQQLSSSALDGQVLSHIHHILCDAVCSGDGTLRKSRDLWERWNYDHGHHNHATQVSILVSAMQIMLTSFNMENTTPLDENSAETTEEISTENGNLKLIKYNGEYEIVYSTCSLNPIEDEAVVAEAIRKTNYRFELVDLEASLQNINNNIKYLKGINDWKVVDSLGNIVEKYEDIQDTSIEFTVKSGDKSENMPKKEGCKKIQPSMFIRDDINDMNLQYTMRILPHMNNSGGFYVAKLRLKKNNSAEDKTKRQRKLQQKMNKKKANQEKNQASHQKQNLKHNIYVRVLPELFNHVINFYEFKKSIDIDINNFVIQTTGESKYVKYLQQFDKNNTANTTTALSLIPTPKKINFVSNKYLSDYLRSNYSYNDSLFLKLFNSGNIAFDIDGGKYQITLAGAVSLFDYIEPESKQLLEISKEELKLFLTEGKIVFENDQIKDMKVGGVILYTKLQDSNKKIIAVGYKHSFNTIFNRLTKDETRNTLVKLDYDFYY